MLKHSSVKHRVYLFLKTGFWHYLRISGFVAWPITIIKHVKRLIKHDKHDFNHMSGVIMSEGGVREGSVIVLDEVSDINM